MGCWNVSRNQIPSQVRQRTRGNRLPTSLAVSRVARQSISTDQVAKPDSAQASVLCPSDFCAPALRIKVLGVGDCFQ